jgi:hypothetical protein
MQYNTIDIKQTYKPKEINNHKNKRKIYGQTYNNSIFKKLDRPTQS